MRRRTLPLPRVALPRSLPPLPRQLPGPRALAFAAAAMVVLVLLFLLVRDSSLVGVDRVTIRGASGPDAARIEAALRDEAQSMTTLHVDKGALERSVADFPVVGALKVHR